MDLRLVGLVLILASAVACEEGKTVSAAPPDKAAPGVPAAAAPVAGMASGKITRPDGKPIGIEGVKYKLTVNGNAGSGNAVAYFPKPAADGTWSTRLADGVYHEPRGTMSVPFDDEVYTYDLYPTAEIGDTDSTKGIVADFHWRIRGPVKRHEDKPDPTNHTHWFGASPSLTWDNTYKVADGTLRSHKLADKTKFVFTATPEGKLIDGTEGKPLTWTLGWDGLLTSIKPGLLNDIPPAVGGWRLTGKLASPDGKERPVLIRLTGTKEEAKSEVILKIVASTYGTPIVGPILECSLAAP